MDLEVVLTRPHGFKPAFGLGYKMPLDNGWYVQYLGGIRVVTLEQNGRRTRRSDRFSEVNFEAT